MSIIGIDNKLYRQLYRQLYRKNIIEKRKKILIKKLFYHKKSYCHCQK